MRRPPADDHEPDADGGEQDLLVVLPLGNRHMGTQVERQAIEAFAEQLAAAIEQAGVGEYDGDELGGGQCTLFFCGPDVDRLIAVLRPLLQRSPLCRGAHFVRMLADAEGRLAPSRQPL